MMISCTSVHNRECWWQSELSVSVGQYDIALYRRQAFKWWTRAIVWYCLLRGTQQLQHNNTLGMHSELPHSMQS